MYVFLLLTEHVVSIIASMLRNCRGPQRQRLLSKFTENDHEKVDRLLELHFKYLDKVEEIDMMIENQRKVGELYILRVIMFLYILFLYSYFEESFNPV